MNSKLFKSLLLTSALTLTPLFQNVKAEAQIMKADDPVNKFGPLFNLNSATISGTIHMIDNSDSANHSTVGQCSDVQVGVNKITSYSYPPGPEPSFPIIEYERVVSSQATGDINSGYCTYTLTLFFPPADELYLVANYLYPVSNLFISRTSSVPIRISVGDQLIRNLQVYRPGPPR